jgi:hypothetical protein
MRIPTDERIIAIDVPLPTCNREVDSSRLLTLPRKLSVYVRDDLALEGRESDLNEAPPFRVYFYTFENPTLPVK